jgi:hypothetical protein
MVAVDSGWLDPVEGVVLEVLEGCVLLGLALEAFLLRQT